MLFWYNTCTSKQCVIKFNMKDEKLAKYEKFMHAFDELFLPEVKFADL